MATQTAVLLGERWLDELLIAASLTNVGADVDEEILPPAGIGDLAIMQIIILSVAEATPVTTPELAAWARIKTAAGGGTVDIVGSGFFGKAAAARHVCSIDPDALCLWRQNDSLNIQYPELDSNGVPTDDHTIYIKCVRVRPVEMPDGHGPLRLVR